MLLKHSKGKTVTLLKSSSLPIISPKAEEKKKKIVSLLLKITISISTVVLLTANIETSETIQ